MIFYDFEVFKHDWLVVLIDPGKREETVIINDREKLEQFHKEHIGDIWIGYNSNWYDQYILKGILCGFDPKEINDFIIVERKDGWMFSSLLRKIPLINYDVLLGNDKGLKSLEGFMGNDIRESQVSFDLQRKMTQEEIDETVKYCRHDVEQTMEVFMKRIDEFNTMMYFIKHFKLPISYLSKTKAQLAAHLLGGNRKGQNFDDEFNFPILDCIQLKKYKHIADWYRNPDNHNYERSQKDVLVAGVEHTFSWGGGHGARKQFHTKGDFIIIDVTAYYPSLQKQYKFGYRVMNNPENFEFIHDSNVEFKRKGDKKARLPFKIMDNAISGQMKQRSSALYDPMSNNSICINGQLLLVDLVEHIEPYCELIQNNTDGIIVKLKDYERDFDIIDGIVADWEKRSGMKMDFDTFFGEIFQKDVNNYLLVDRETGAVKAKGSYVKKLSDLDYDLPILNKALSKFMIDGIPVKTTIDSCDDLKEFQLVAKVSNKYSELWYGGSFRYEKLQDGKKIKKYNHDGTPIKERCIRIFASKDKGDGVFYKKKASTGSFEKVQNCPEHSFMFNDSVNGVKVPDKLDKQWYVTKAEERLKDFGINVC